jgi:hypothetical protein
MRRSQNEHAVGRCPVALVCLAAGEPRAVISAVMAQSCSKRKSLRLTFAGPVLFDEPLQRHLHQVLLPIVDDVATRLGLPVKNYKLSAVNLAAASSMDVGIAVSGFSADAALFLAMLSVQLGLPIPQDTLVTGHVASVEGDLAQVRAIPEKLRAAIEHPTIGQVVYPNPDDPSLATLTPDQATRMHRALEQAREKITLTGVRNLAELVRVIFPPESVVLPSLREGFFDRNLSSDVSRDEQSPIGQLTDYLVSENPSRFWLGLEKRLLAGESREAHRWVKVFIDFHKKRRRYPEAFGTRLWSLVVRLPPLRRRALHEAPLFSEKTALALCQLSPSPGSEEIRQLLAAGFGKISERGLNIPLPPSSPDSSIDPADHTLQTILEEISQSALAARIGISIDQARAGFTLDPELPASFEAFSQTISRFYLHLVRGPDGLVPDSCLESAADEAFALLGRTFPGERGVEEAWSNVREGLSGGLRVVLDRMTEQYKKERYVRYVNRVLKEALDPLDWEPKVTLMRSLFRRLEGSLPQDLRNRRPEFYARHYELLVQAYVHSLDQIHHLLRVYG